MHRDSSPLGPHLRSLFFYYGSTRPDVIVNDLAHAVPWLSPIISDIPGTVFFRHLHRRSLAGQVSAPLAALLGGVEKQYRFIYRSWPIVTETNGSVADLESLGFSRGQCVRIPPGVDICEHKSGVRDELPTLVYFGGMRRYKRPLDAVYASKALLDRGWNFKLFMVGEGPLLDSIKKIVAVLGIGKHVLLTGRLSDSELISLIQRSHVNVHCSMTEGWCLSAMEAAACGVPTVAYRVPWLAESVIDGRTGLLVDDGNSAALADGIETVLRNPGSWSENCRTHALEFSWENSASKWENHLKAVADGKGTFV